MTKPCVLRPLATQDKRSELRYYRREAGGAVANKLLDALEKTLVDLRLNPAIGSPTLGHMLDVTGLGTWRINGFPLSFWYFERDTHVDIARLVGQRQDADAVDVSTSTR